MNIAISEAAPLHKDEPPSQLFFAQSAPRERLQTNLETQTHTWLLPLNAVLLQLLAIILFFSLAGYTKASTDDYLAKPQTNWLNLAALIDDEKRPLLHLKETRIKDSWAFALDNDLLAPGHRDRDYTYGMNFTYSGNGARDAEISLKEPLGYIDNLLGMDQLPSKYDNYSIEAGLFGLRQA